MNLPGIPFELILIVLFFVLPALGNLQRRFRGRGGQPGEADTAAERERRQPPTRPRAEAQRTPTQASTRTSTSTTTTTSTPTQTQPPIGTPRWLEEAQRRVREAQGEEPGRPVPRTDPRNVQQPRTTGKPLFEPAPKTAQPAARPVQTRPAGSLEGPALAIRSLETLRPEGSTNRAAKTAQPLRVQRSGADKGVTINPDKLRFDTSTLMNGVAWHQVLSPPLSKRRTRLSPRRP